MRRKLALALLIAMLLTAAPSVTRAAVIINISPLNYPPTPTGTDTVAFFEVFGTDVTAENEHLNAYTIAIQGVGTGADGKPFGDPNGVRFQVPGLSFGVAGRPTDHPYVFKDLDTIPPIENFSSTPSKLQFAATAIGQDDEVDVDLTHNGFLRFGVIIPADFRFGTYTITVTTTSLAGRGAPIVSTPGQPAVIAVIPEPTASALLLAPALALLRRRRGA